MCITTNQPDNKPNPNHNTTIQHSAVSVQLNIVTYPEKFMRDSVITLFSLLFFVTVHQRYQQSTRPSLSVYRFRMMSTNNQNNWRTHILYISDWDPFAEDIGIESDCDTEEEVRRFVQCQSRGQFASFQAITCHTARIIFQWNFTGSAKLSTMWTFKVSVFCKNARGCQQLNFCPRPLCI